MKTGNSTAFSYSFDDVVVDSATFCVRKDGRIRTLAPRCFDLLIYLIEHSERVIDKQELFDELWGDRFVTDNALARAIKQIRNALGDHADAPRYIQTVPKRGYRFVSEFKKSPRAENASPLVEDSGAIPSQQGVVHELSSTVSGRAGFRPRRSKWFALGATLCLVSVAGIASWRRRAESAVVVPAGVPKREQIHNWSGFDAFPALSPDGNSLAYISDHAGGLEIFVKPLLPGGKEVQLTSDGQGKFEPAWSPDGKFIAYRSGNRGGIWSVAASGGTPKQHAEFGSQPAWSPDGTVIVFQSLTLTELSETFQSAVEPSVLWTVDVRGGDPRPLTRIGAPPGRHNSASWSRDGKHIVFVAHDGDTRAIWIVSEDGTEMRQLIGGVEWVFNPVFSADQQKVYYGGVSRQGRRVLLRLSISSTTGEAVGSPVEVLDIGPIRIKQLSISTTGKKIAYSTPARTGIRPSPVFAHNGRNVVDAQGTVTIWLREFK